MWFFKKKKKKEDSRKPGWYEIAERRFGKGEEE